MFIENISCTNTKAGTYLLKCQADGNPKMPIVWYKDGKVIQVSLRVYIGGRWGGGGIIGDLAIICCTM